MPEPDAPLPAVPAPISDPGPGAKPEAGDGTIPPRHIAIIGSTGTGTGTGGAPITTGTVGTTPDHMPNTVYQVVSPLVAIAVRFAHLFGKTLLASITVGSSGLIPLGDFPHVFHASLEFALATAVVGFLGDCITIFSRLEQKFPLATGAI